MKRSGRRTRRPPDVRRASILDAAERLVVERGIDAITMADVAAASDVAKGTVYLYFDSRDELIRALRERFADELLAGVRGALATGGRGDRGRRLDRFVNDLVTAYGSASAHRRFHALFEDPRASEAAIMDAGRAALRGFIADGVSAGEFSVPDVDAATDFLLHGLHGALRGAAHGGTVPLAPLKAFARRTLGA